MIDLAVHQLFAEKMAQKVAQATMDQAIAERRATLLEQRCNELHTLCEDRRVMIEELESVIAELRLQSFGESQKDEVPK